jgi:MinD-like ATPase involved in chromosome partitioning or flagellar assembly
MSSNPNKYRGSQKAESLALLSGKGGSGKTVIGLSMARILAEAGLNVLLVDCDLATHGATYFMEAEFSEPFLTLTSVSDLLLQKGPRPPRAFATKAGFHFIPSLLDPSTKHEYPLHSEVMLEGWWSSIVSSYDAIILDCQAGYSDIADWAGRTADRKLMVLEPDAVSAAALRVLSLQLGYSLRSSSTWQVFNKLTEEERPIYERVAGGTLFTNLPPLPFDWQVRAAFALGEIPGVLSTSSAFGLGILRLMQTLFPRFAAELKNLEKTSVGDWYENLSGKLDKLHSLREEIKYRNIEIKRRQRVQVVSSVSLLLGTLGATLAVFPFIKTEFVNGRFLTTGVGIFLVMASVFLLAQFQRGLRAEREQDVTQDELARIENDIRKFETLISTDPRLKEYATKREERTAVDIEERGSRPQPPDSEVIIVGKGPITQEANADPEHRQKPSGREIYDEIQKLPILSRAAYAASYKGRLVEWRLTVSSVGELDKVGNVRLSLMEKPHALIPTIWCEVSLAEYPELKRIHDGAPLVAKGRISRISGTSIYLEQVSLNFTE